MLPERSLIQDEIKECCQTPPGPWRLGCTIGSRLHDLCIARTDAELRVGPAVDLQHRGFSSRVIDGYPSSAAGPILSLPEPHSAPHFDETVSRPRDYSANSPAWE